MRAFLFILIIMVLTSNIVFAGGSTGGGFPSVQLEAMALSETRIMLARKDLDSLNILSPQRAVATAPRALMMMERTPSPNGILIEVRAEDMETVLTNAKSGGEFSYHEAAAQPVSVDSESNSVTLQLIDDPSVIIVVKESQAE